MSNFKEVGGGFLPQWNPRWSGSKKKNNLVILDASEKSFMDGYYLGTRTGMIGTDPVKIHKMKLVAAGDDSHVNEDIPEGGLIVEFVGSGVIDKKIAEELNGGELVRIQWDGKVENKTNPERKYHMWRLFVDHEAEPMAVKGGHVIAEGEVAAAESGTGEDEDSDLPF